MPEKCKTLSARLKRLLESKRITIELRDEKGQESMAQSALEQMGVQIDETARKASRAASAVADALEDGGGAARRITKQGSRAAAELLAETRKRVQRLPIETVAAAFAAGIVAGSVIPWILKRRQC
jgi:Tfp pilus assembly protein PilX